MSECLNILSWNINKKAKSKQKDLTESISRSSPDIIVLQEYNGGEDGKMIHSLRDLDFVYIAYRSINRKRGNLVALAKTPFVCKLPPDHIDVSRWLHIYFPERQLDILGIHTPDVRNDDLPTTRKQKQHFWDMTLRVAKSNCDSACVIIGDFNTGVDGVDSGAVHPECKPAKFESQGSFCELSSIFVDAWRYINGSKTEYTYFSRRPNPERVYPTALASGYRLDHAFVSNALKTNIQACYYSDDPRTGISDHAALHLKLAI